MIGNCAYANAEITKLYLTKWNKNIVVYYSPNSSTILNNRITGFSGLTEDWSEIPFNTAIATYNQTLNSLNPNGINFTENLTVNIPHADLLKWNDLETLLANRYIIVIGDANGHYWCIGERFGFRITSYSREENQYVIIFGSNLSLPL
jgi:hypothetical protein